jgi:diguanylate cyclase (GGDEF)-like protein
MFSSVALPIGEKMRMHDDRTAVLNRRDEGTPGPVLQPYSRESLFRRFGPIVGLVLLALLYAVPPRSATGSDGTIMQAAFLAAVAAAATLVLPWQRFSRAVQILPPVVYLMVVFLIREGTGNVTATYSELVLIPVLWMALYGGPRELAAVLFAAAGAIFTPLFTPGAPHGAWNDGFLLLGAAAVLSFAIQLFLGRVREQADRLYRLANTDSLTGVANRRGWEFDLAKALAASHRDHQPLCLVMLDLDHFKMFNDRNGHQAGDLLLKEVAAKWSARLRQTDVLARLGGDEFGVVLRFCPTEAAYGIAYRLCLALPYGVTSSAGVAAWDGSESTEDLIARADRGLYRAKEEGRNRVVSTPFSEPEFSTR